MCMSLCVCDVSVCMCLCDVSVCICMCSSQQSQVQTKDQRSWDYYPNRHSPQSYHSSESRFILQVIKLGRVLPTFLILKMYSFLFFSMFLMTSEREGVLEQEMTE